MSQDTTIDKLRNIFADNKNKVMIIDAATDEQFTYSRIEDLSKRLSIFMSEKGLTKGDKVSILLDNCVEYVIVYFGVGSVSIFRAINGSSFKFYSSAIDHNTDGKGRNLNHVLALLGHQVGRQVYEFPLELWIK